MTDELLKSDFSPYSEAAWLEAISVALKGGTVDDLKTSEIGGLSRQPLYRRDDIETANDPSGLPGHAPFIRGSQSSRDKHLPWQIAQRYRPGRRGHANRDLLTDLNGGVSTILLDLSSQTAPDLAQLDKLFAGVMLDIAPLALAPGIAISKAQEVMDHLWSAQSINEEDQLGYLNADPIGAAMVVNETINLDLVASSLNWGKNKPKVKLLCASGLPYQAAGAGEADELALTMATLVSYIDTALASGFTAQQIAERTVVAIAADLDFFATIAKIRAARLMWSQIFSAYDVKAVAPFIISETSERSFSTVDPWVNILRATVSSCAAAVAGADMLTVAPCTSVAEGDNDLSRRVARNTQIIMQEESHLGHVMDPAGGSWYVEKLTQDLALQAWNKFQTLEAEGGLIKALETGSVANTLKTAREERMQKINTRAMALIGVSEFPNIDEAPLAPRPQDPSGAFAPSRLAEAFEKLRQRAEPVKPKVFLAALGTPARATARVNFAANIYAVGGVQTITGEGGDDVKEIASAFQKSGAKIACICGAETDYDISAEALAKALKAVGAVHIAMAGKPRAIGEIDNYCYAGCDTLSFAEVIHASLGLEA